MTTARDARDSVEALEAGTPKARTARESVEALAKGTAKARTARESVEVVAKGTAKARTARESVEVLYSTILPTTARTARESAEVAIAGPAVARTARESVEVLIDPEVIYDLTGTETLGEPADVADPTISLSRVPSEGLDEPGDGTDSTLLLERGGSESLPVTDEADKSIIKTRGPSETLSAPSDVAAGTIHHLLVRYGVEVLTPPHDTLAHLTHLGEFRPSFESPGRRLVRIEPGSIRPTRTASNWSSDVPVSKPRPFTSDQPVLVDFGGLGFTTGGIAHNLTETEAEVLFTPVFAPEETFDGQ